MPDRTEIQGWMESVAELHKRILELQTQLKTANDLCVAYRAELDDYELTVTKLRRELNDYRSIGTKAVGTTTS